MGELFLHSMNIVRKAAIEGEEFYFAILSGAGYDKLASEYITKQDIERFILSSSKSFVEVTKLRDQTIQFIHESVSDFLLKENGLNNLWSEFGNKFLSVNFLILSHERLKQCCYNYIKINISEDGHVPVPPNSLLPTESSAPTANFYRLLSDRFPLLKYVYKMCSIMLALQRAVESYKMPLLKIFP